MPLAMNRSGAVAERSYHRPEVRGGSREKQLHGCRRAEGSYSTLKVRRGSREKIPLVQG